MKISQIDSQVKQNNANCVKPAFGDLKVEFQKGVLDTFIGTLNNKFNDKDKTIKDIMAYANNFRIENPAEGIVKITKLSVNNEKNIDIPEFSMDTIYNGRNITKTVGGVKHPSILYPSQILEYFESALKFLKLNLAEKKK